MIVSVLHRASALVACVDIQDEKGEALARARSSQLLAVDGGITVGPRSAWEESAVIESWPRLGLSEEQVRDLLNVAGS